MEDDSETLQNRVFEFAKHNFLVVGLLIGGLIFIAVGLTQMMGQKTATVEFEKGAQVEGASTHSAISTASSSKIMIDVEGQVQKPGVYSLNSDARVQDALVAAGGLGQNADRNALNLAQRVADGQKVYVPAVGESAEQTMVISEGSVNSNAGSVGGLISVNSADQAALESLPGIGPVTAGKIISNRPYNTLDDLVSKKALGHATFDKIRGQISL